MPFAPHEIENKRFVVALRGYQTDEVDAFLRAVAADYRALQRVTEAARGKPEQWVSDIERVMSTAREDAEREAAAIRAAAEAEAAAIREAAERDATELRETTQREAEACFAEIERQAAELRRLEAGLWHRMHALEHAVIETRQSLAHASGLYPMAPEDDPLYRARESSGLETYAAAATPLR
jgi:DivIVA domain-containing protein